MTTPRRRYAARRRSKPTGSPISGEPAFVLVGILRRPHGLQGEVLVSLETDFPERLQPGARLYVGEDHRPVTISKRREHNDGLLLAFEEFPSVEDVEGLRNVPLSAAVADRPPLPAGEYYQHQLLGLEVIEDSGEPLGTLVDILHTGGNEVFVVRPEDGGELLLPAIDQVVRAVDLKAKRMIVHLLPGLRAG